MKRTLLLMFLFGAFNHDCDQCLCDFVCIGLVTMNCHDANASTALVRWTKRTGDVATGWQSVGTSGKPLGCLARVRRLRCEARDIRSLLSLPLKGVWSAGEELPTGDAVRQGRYVFQEAL